MSKLIKTAIEAGIHDTYYALCDAYPLRSECPKISVSAKNLMAASSGRIALKKLSGPGSVYKLLSLPDDLGLNFIIQGREIVETHFRIEVEGMTHEGSFVVLSNALLHATGRVSRTPPYPRPAFYSMEQLINILLGFELMIGKLAHHIRVNGTKA